jgi:hypothetical protein
MILTIGAFKAARPFNHRAQISRVWKGRSVIGTNFTSALRNARDELRHGVRETKCESEQETAHKRLIFWIIGAILNVECASSNFSTWQPLSWLVCVRHERRVFSGAALVTSSSAPSTDVVPRVHAKNSGGGGAQNKLPRLPLAPYRATAPAPFPPPQISPQLNRAFLLEYTLNGMNFLQARMSVAKEAKVAMSIHWKIQQNALNENFLMGNTHAHGVATIQMPRMQPLFVWCSWMGNIKIMIAKKVCVFCSFNYSILKLWSFVPFFRIVIKTLCCRAMF